MSKQKAIGYVRDSRGKATSMENQRTLIKQYCEKQGYELIDYFETKKTLDGDQLDRLEEYIREHLGIAYEVVRLIPTTLSRLSKSLDTTRTMMIDLQSMGIELEVVDVGSQNRVELWRSMQDPHPQLTARISEGDDADDPSKRVICSYCGGSGDNYYGCACTTVEIEGKYYKRIPFGSEKSPKDLPFCPDCGALPGRYHHSCCDVEQCPVCGKSIYACACQMAFVFEEDYDARDDEAVILQIAQAVHAACEADLSKSKKAEVREYVEENYDPELSSEENAALIAVMYLSEAKSARSAAGKAHAKSSGHSGRRKKKRKSK